MCKIEFLGWSKSCTKYNFCSTLAQKRIGCSTLLQARILVFSDKKLDWEYVLIHIVWPRAHSKWKPIQRFRFSSGWNLWMRIVQLPYKVEFCCIFHKRFKIQIQAHRSQVKTNLLLWQVTDEASSGALCFRPQHSNNSHGTNQQQKVSHQNISKDTLCDKSTKADKEPCDHDGKPDRTKLGLINHPYLLRRLLRAFLSWRQLPTSELSCFWFCQSAWST